MFECAKAELLARVERQDEAYASPAKLLKAATELDRSQAAADLLANELGRSRAATAELIEDAIELERSRAESEFLEDALFEAARTHAETHERAICDAYATIRTQDLLIESLRADNIRLKEAFRLQRLQLTEQKLREETSRLSFNAELESLQGQLLSAAVTPCSMPRHGSFPESSHEGLSSQEQDRFVRKHDTPTVPACTTECVEHALPLPKAKPTASKAQPRTSAAKRGVSAHSASRGCPLSPQLAQRSPARALPPAKAPPAKPCVQGSVTVPVTVPLMGSPCKSGEPAQEASVANSACAWLAHSDNATTAHADWIAMLPGIRDFLRYFP
jgi:hypothetical protein